MEEQTQLIVGTQLASKTLHGMYLEVAEIRDFVEKYPDSEWETDLRDLIEAGEAAIAGKIDRLGFAIRYAKLAVETMEEVVEKKKRKVEALNAILKKTLEINGGKALEGAVFRAALVPNGGPEPLEIDKDALPSEYVDEIIEVIRKPRRSLIATDIKAGKEIPGVMRKERGTHVRINSV